METLPTVPALLHIPSLDLTRAINDARELAALIREAREANIHYTVSPL